MATHGKQDINDAALTILDVSRVQDLEKEILTPTAQRIQSNNNKTTVVLVDSLHPFMRRSLHQTYQLVKALDSFTSGNHSI